MKCYLLLRYYVLSVFLLLLFFGVVKTSYGALSYTQVYPVASTTAGVTHIDSSGITSFNNLVCVTGCGGTLSFTVHTGVYPNSTATSTYTTGVSGAGLIWFDYNFLKGTGLVERKYKEVKTPSSTFFATGNYWFDFYSQNNGSYYMQFSVDSSGVATFLPFNTTTRFTGINIATSTQTVNIQVYWNATTTSGITERLFIYQNGLITGYTELLTDSYPLLQSMFTATTTGAFNFTVPYKVLLSSSTATTTTPITSTSTILAYIYQYNNTYATDPFTGLTDSRYKTLLTATTTTITGYTGYKIDTIQQLNLYPEYECSITSFTGCLKNAFIWSFYPTQDVINSFNNFTELIQNKAPFGYGSIVIRAITGINASSTPTFTVNIPKTLKTIFFTPIDILIGSALWLFFVFNFYKRIKNITI